MENVEILAPCGDFDSLVSAISAGCDAVYLGIGEFNARIRARNFTLDEAKEAIELAHAHRVKVYITLNIALYEREIPKMLEYVVALWNMGADAFIVSDLGVMRTIKKYYPEIELHASTQCTVHNLDGADFLKDTIGVSRVVLARELDKNNIEYIAKNAECETEIFVHGAHCMSVSGQCLMSYAMGGRSGNRGECAQPCRLPYTLLNEKSYPLSLKDMSLASCVPEILACGASSLKIEGRMKDSSYVGGAVEIWRRLIDEQRSANKGELSTLGGLFSRQGFTDGYFTSKINKSMLGIRTDEDKRTTSQLKAKEYRLDKAYADIYAEFIAGKRAKITLLAADKGVSCYGDIVEKAINAPISKDDIIKNLSKLGNTPFQIGKIEVEMSPDIMVRVSSINALRREAVKRLFEREYTLEQKEYQTEKAEGVKRIKTAFFSSPLQIPKSKDFFDVVFVYLDRYEKGHGINGICLPPVICDNEWKKIEILLDKAKADGVTYALVTNIGQMYKVKELGFKVICDFRFNAFNVPCVNYLIENGAENVILSPELSLAQLRDFPSYSVIAYGKFPVMTSHKCILKDSYGCDKCKGYLKDRQGANFFTEGVFGHRCVIHNSVPIYMADKLNEIEHFSHHFVFTDESRDKCEEIINNYKNKRSLNGSFKRIK
ncbi:MAG: U32 family peptidase [Clostridia bacterium]|nr:U32 family peptidase [Clostridia bacterium]